ncbi:hypothetical protein [Arthrobacter sp. MYb213]|uniref:hypothetical protein n=1 Tax=Arthrobacter sp. MYb213 TaxID=1848595 RepID=UPI000CFAC1A7|nr:hypothetical protein [Arthrobacter sp. MYb213]PRB69501.1 hypothetical protein CQ011_12120 [Arthrobacter sp. MYb213]
MSTVIEARRLNNTDLGKTISFPETEGVLCGVIHGYFGHKTETFVNRYVCVIVDGENQVLEPSDKVTITGKESKP